MAFCLISFQLNGIVTALSTTCSVTLPQKPGEREGKKRGDRNRSSMWFAERVAFVCACCRCETVRPHRRLYLLWKWRIPSSECPGGGRQSSRRDAVFGLHPFRRGGLTATPATVTDLAVFVFFAFYVCENVVE